MKLVYNPFTGNLDWVQSDLDNPLQFKGDIALNTDFPVSPEQGWFYTVSDSVTDPYRGGLSFVSGDEIAFDGSDWVLLGNTLNHLKLDQSTPQQITGTVLADHFVSFQDKTYAYNLDGTINTITFSDGRVITYTYTSGEVVSWTDTIRTWTVVRDVNGNITNINIT